MPALAPGAEVADRRGVSPNFDDTFDPFLPDGSPSTKGDLPALAFAGDATQGAPTLPEIEVSGSIAPTFASDWYGRVHVIPLTIDLKNIVQVQERTVEVWNAHFEPKTLAEIEEEGTEGLTLGGHDDPPLEYGALQSRTYTLTAALEGPPLIDATFAFDFTSETPILAVIGSRIVVFPYSAQRPVVEVVEFLTDVLEARTGHEQRIRVRPKPRNGYRMRYRIADSIEAARLFNLLFGWHGRRFAVPLWQYARPLLADLTSGATAVPVDTEYADFRSGSLAIIWRDSGDWEVAEILDVHPGQLDLVRGLEGDHPALGSVVVPVHLAVAGDPADYGRTPNNVIAVNLEWLSVEYVDLAASDEELPLYKNMPVLADLNFGPDAGAAEGFRADYTVVDSDAGVFEVIPHREAVEVRTVKRWDTEDPAEAWAIRRLLYALRGRQRSFWLPSFREDFRLVETVASSATTLEVEQAEFGRFVGLQEPLKHVEILLRDGTVFRREIIDVAPSGDHERLTIDETLGQEVTPGDVVRISYLLRARLDADRIELEHSRAGALAVTVPVVGVLQ